MEIVVSQEQLMDFLSNPSEDVDSISDTVSYVFDTLIDSGYEGLHLDNLLTQDLSQVNAVHLAAMIRALNFQKNIITQWPLLLQKTRDLCLAQNQDVSDVLYGFEADLDALS